MEEKQVIKALAALAQAHRLQIFRALVVTGTQGLTPAVMVDCSHANSAKQYRRQVEVAADLARMTAEMGDRAAGRTPVAVFQADCTARGRHLFTKSARARLLAGMQSAFAGAVGTPPWLGIYGLGQFVPVDGRNECLNYASGLCALYRRPGDRHA